MVEPHETHFFAKKITNVTFYCTWHLAEPVIEFPTRKEFVEGDESGKGDEGNRENIDVLIMIGLVSPGEG